MEKETKETEKEIGKAVRKEEGKLIRLKLKDIKPYKRNAKLHPESQITKIRDSIINFGYKDLIAVDENNVVLEGHGRLRALQQIDTTLEKEIPVWRIEDLKESEKKAYRIIHNKLNMDTGFDFDILKEEFYDLEDTGNFEDTGFEREEITEIWDEDKEVVEDKVAVDAYERAKVKTKIKEGDVYLLGDHRLMCGDATKEESILKLVKDEKVDIVFTDPPYGNAESGKYGRGQLGVRTIQGDENIDCLRKLLNMKIADTNIFFMQWRSFYEILSAIKEQNIELKTIAVWDKKNAGLNGAGGISEQWEAVFFTGTPKYRKFGGNVFCISREQKQRKESPHPHQKPIELIAEILSFVEVDTLLDPFGGSGSTLIACEQLNRKCYMMEIDPVYCQIVIDRWEKLTKKQAIKE